MILFTIKEKIDIVLKRTCSLLMVVILHIAPWINEQLVSEISLEIPWYYFLLELDMDIDELLDNASLELSVHHVQLIDRSLIWLYIHCQHRTPEVVG